MGGVAMVARREPVLEMRPWFTILTVLIWNAAFLLSLWFSWSESEVIDHPTRDMPAGVVRTIAIVSFTEAAVVAIVRAVPSLIPLFFRSTTSPVNASPGWLLVGLLVSGVVTTLMLYLN
jgi:hypothetical protein